MMVYRLTFSEESPNRRVTSESHTVHLSYIRAILGTEWRANSFSDKDLSKFNEFNSLYKKHQASLGALTTAWWVRLLFGRSHQRPVVITCHHHVNITSKFRSTIIVNENKAMMIHCKSILHLDNMKLQTYFHHNL